MDLTHEEPAVYPVLGPAILRQGRTRAQVGPCVHYYLGRAPARLRVLGIAFVHLCRGADSPRHRVTNRRHWGRHSHSLTGRLAPTFDSHD